MTHPFDTFTEPLQVGRQQLSIFRLELVGELSVLFESYEVADMLGYTQHSSLRKQTLTDWKFLMEKHHDFIMVHDEEALLAYDKLYTRVHRLSISPTKPTRGRLFFTLRGLVKVLRKTTKDTTELEARLRASFPNIDWNPSMVLKPREFVRGQPCHRCGRSLDSNADCPCTPLPKAKVKEEAPEVPGPAFRPTMGSFEQRKFEYHVMQTLIGQLASLKDATLRSLALQAAESALGRRLDEVRTREAIQGVFSKTTKGTPSKVKVEVEGPLFTDNGYHSMTRIGEKAGGYSPKQAGLAADIVAAGMGYTRDQIRNQNLSFNQIALRPDTTTGKKRQMVRFHTSFANKIVKELRSNASFEPTTWNAQTSLTPFSSPLASYPRLSLGPLDEQS